MKTLTVFVADEFEQSGLDALAKLGCNVVQRLKLKDSALAAAVGEAKAEVLIVRSTQVTREILEAPELTLVVRAGAGVNTIDLNAAAENGVYVANCPGKNSTAVAELAFGLIISLDRRIPENVIASREGKWEKKLFSKAQGLRGRTLGIVGLGQIGKEVAQFAVGFGMKVLAWSRSLTAAQAEEMGVVRCDSILDVAKHADVISVHLALAAETKGMLNKEFFDAMKANAIFVNTARAEVVDEAAMMEAAKTKGIRVGTDVPSNEPGAADKVFNSPLKDAQGIVYVTHHIGASTEQAQQAVAMETVRIVKEFMEAGQVPNCVNLRTRSRATGYITVRHRDRVGVLAEVLAILRDARVNVQEMENIFFEGADTACARIRVDGEISPPVVEAVRKANHVLNVTAH